MSCVHGDSFTITFGALPDDVLKCLIEISQFFKNLCSTTLREDMLEEMHGNIVRIARLIVSDADVDTIIKTHFADWFSQNVRITTHSFIILT